MIKSYHSYPLGFPKHVLPMWSKHSLEINYFTAGKHAQKDNTMIFMNFSFCFQIIFCMTRVYKRLKVEKRQKLTRHCDYIHFKIWIPHPGPGQSDLQPSDLRQGVSMHIYWGISMECFDKNMVYYHFSNEFLTSM